MSIEIYSDDSTDTQLSLIESTHTLPERVLSLDAHPDVEVTPKPSAHCCGALGCRETDVLQEVTIDGYGARVVCPSHAEHLVGRETR